MSSEFEDFGNRPARRVDAPAQPAAPAGEASKAPKRSLGDRWNNASRWARSIAVTMTALPWALWAGHAIYQGINSKAKKATETPPPTPIVRATDASAETRSDLADVLQVKPDVIDSNE